MSGIEKDLMGEEVNAEIVGAKKGRDVMKVYLQGNLCILLMSTDKGEKVEVYRRVKK